MQHLAYPHGVTRDALIEWYQRYRSRTKEIFDLVTPDAYYERPIALRNPIVFYEGHLPAFSVNTLAKLGHRRGGVDEKLEVLFARGIDPEDEAAVKNPTDLWPSRDEVQEYGHKADALVLDLLAHAPLSDDAHPPLQRGEAVFTIIEHEAMHHETLLYMFHNLPYDKKVARSPFTPAETRERAVRSGGTVRIPRGRATLGARRDSHYGWDNEFPQFTVDVPEFEIETHNVTNGAYLEYVEATGAPAPHFWSRGDDGAWMRRGMFALEPLPLDAPVYVTHDEAAAYARWKGMRLPTEAEYHRAAFGTPSGIDRLYPWGDDLPNAAHGNFDLQSWDPVNVGSHPEGASAWGVHDLFGNGWEWTSSLFAGFDGFAPMPSYSLYSTDFFDNAHYVLKGASPVTARELVRGTFRNWFRPNYPYVFATFRCVK
ncbi:MAG TPA: SUMF1/EgtB/PvdO family nonheme iron enzyme [Thermoanaerobaculia bacterium]|nr:SUMF1/EgtB/PvdO family nonheme iron enzyme [Thermoanaerobaculia bacterium]